MRLDLTGHGYALDNGSLLAMRAAVRRGDVKRARALADELPPTDVNNPDHVSWYFDRRMSEIESAERSGRVSGTYARRARAEAANEFRESLRPYDPETGKPMLSDAEMAALRAEYGV